MPYRLISSPFDHLVCGDLISSADNVETFLNWIIKGDEIWHFLYDAQLKRQSTTWKTPLSPERKIPLTDRSRSKVMLEPFFYSSEKFHLEFNPQEGTINKIDECLYKKNAKAGGRRSDTPPVLIRSHAKQFLYPIQLERKAECA